jgi:hypothetical protein
MKPVESIILNIAIAGMILWALYFLSNDMEAGAVICGVLSFLGLAYLEVCDEKSQSPSQSKREE